VLVHFILYFNVAVCNVSPELLNMILLNVNTKLITKYKYIMWYNLWETNVPAMH